MEDKAKTTEEIQEAATSIRKRILRFALDRNGCYLTQACSSAEMVATLFLRSLKLNPSIGDPHAQAFPGVPSKDNMDYPKGWYYYGELTPDRDRLFVSCCHYAAVIYCGLVEAGRMDEDALEKFNVDGWNMEMIGAEHSPGFENTAGSLGQTVSIAAGVAHAYKMQGKTGRIFCMLSDGELQEGQDWECFEVASHLKLGNFTVIADINHQQLEGWTKDCIDLEPLDKRFEAFGWKVLRIDGHDIEAIDRACQTPHPDQPMIILCDTNPAQGIPLLEDMVPKHFVRVPDAKKDAFEAFYAQM